MTQVLSVTQSSQEHSSDPLSSRLVFTNQVEEVLRFDKGENAQMTSWTTKDFTSKGDNYVSIITSVVVQFCLDEQTQEETYIVKIKQTKQNGSASDFDNMVFNKEGKFYSELLPILNSELVSIEHDPLKMPRYLHSNWHEEQSHLFLEDLRAQQYKLYSRKKGLDTHHAKLVLQELGRFHASSYLLQSKNPERKIHQDFNFLNWEWFTYSERTKKAIEILVEGGLRTAAIIAKEAGKERVSKWYQEIAPNGVKILEEQVMCNSPSFDLIGHGDCWSSNLLFKYNNDGIPVDLMILDLQFCRQSNLALDLNYFFFTSLSRNERRENLNELLLTYHNSFKTIMAAASMTMPFTLEELENEYRKTNIFGLIMSTLLMPNILCDPEDVQEFDGGADGHSEDYVEKKRNRTLKMLQNNAVFSQRITEIFDDISELMALT